MNDNLFQISFYWMNYSRPFSLSVPRSFKSKQGINFVVILSFTNSILHTPPPALQYSYPSWEVVKVLLSEKKKIKKKSWENFCAVFLTVSSALTWLSFRCLLQDTNTHTHTVTHLLYLFLFWFCFCFCFWLYSRAWEVLWSRKKLVTTAKEREKFKFQRQLWFLLCLFLFNSSSAWFSSSSGSVLWRLDIISYYFLVFFRILAFGFGLEPLWRGHCYNYGNSHCGFSLSCLCVCGFLGQRNFWFPHEWREGRVRGETGLQQSKT